MKCDDPFGPFLIMERYDTVAVFSPFVGDDRISYQAVRETMIWSRTSGFVTEEDVVSAAIEMLTCLLEELIAQRMRKLFPVRAVALALALILITLLIGVLQ